MKFSSSVCLTASILLVTPLGHAVAQDIGSGEKVFKKCAACHQVGPDAKSKVGPSLNGIIGAAAGQVEGFKYSGALLESGLTWDEAALASFLKNPKETVPKTKMVFGGLKKDDEVADVIAYLATFNADGSQN